MEPHQCFLWKHILTLSVHLNLSFTRQDKLAMEFHQTSIPFLMNHYKFSHLQFKLQKQHTANMAISFS
jgi:hypothetical protein